MKNNIDNNASSLNDNGQCSKINPVFDSLESPSTFISHVEELLDSKSEDIECEKNAFPVDVFPKAVQEIIKATHECLNFPIDFIGSSILYAISVAIGNSHRVELMKGWQENAVLYMAIVGRPGTNKSHPLSFALKPIEDHDNLRFQEYQIEKNRYDSFKSLSVKERELQNEDELVKPIWKQHLVTDFTPESLVEVLKYNKRGIGVYVDELASWFKNFNRYNKGSEEQFWLSIWSGKPIRISRKTSDPNYLLLPFVSVAGTIQPSVLNELAKDRTENGFLDRLLFVVPDDLKKQYWSESELSPLIFENWERIINNLIYVQTDQIETKDIEPKILKFEADAKKCLFDWQRKITDLSNETESDTLRGVYAKIEMYAIRLALCLEMTLYACGKKEKNTICLESVIGALKLVDYFKNSAVKVHSIVSSVSVLDKLPKDRLVFYNTLPNSFTTDQGVRIANDSGIAERTFKNFISNSALFHNTKRGHYEKRF
jgi:hypothetical protein